MPTSIYGVPIFLAVAVFFFAAAVVIGMMRGGWRHKVPEGGPVPMRSGGGGMLQTLAAILGITSFVMQVLQWLKII